ncbi:uncharacterized protein LOC134237349 [Saccostrea cucullata]|uniref:uncharacterized protein LOC134237349 n=1 Tax=Saccostrea cuccullata TaxID=36930 RepID=UPI002ED41B6E
MGGETSSHSQQTSEKFQAAFKRVADVAHIPTCANFWMYKEKIRPILEHIIGGEQIRQCFKVQKSDMFTTAMSHYKGKASEIRRKSATIRHEVLMIVFDDSREYDYDGGGFRREFYSTFFLQAIRDRGLFIGNFPRLVPNFSQDRLDDLTAVGIGIVEAILNFDCGFPYLNPGLFHFMVEHDDYEQYLTVEDIPNPEVKYLVDQLLKCSTDDEINDVIQSEEGNVVGHIGWPAGKHFNMKSREQLIQMLIKYSIIDERRPAIDALMKGLNYLNFLDKTKDVSLLEPLFVHSEEYSINKEYLKKILLPALEGLNAVNDKLQKAKDYAIRSVNEINDEEARALYHFITGLASPSVSQEQLNAEFIMANPQQKEPEAMTCFEKLMIPVGNKDYEEFKKSFQHAIKTFESLD